MPFISYNVPRHFPSLLFERLFFRYNRGMTTIEASAVDVYVFFRKAGRPLYLLLHRAIGKRYAGLWRIVAGKIEPGERPVITAVREMVEETGLRPIHIWSLDYLHTFYDTVDDRVNLIPSFVIEVQSMDIVLSDEHDDSRWVTFEQALELLRWPGQREGLHRAHEDITTSPDRGAPFSVTVNV